MLKTIEIFTPKPYVLMFLEQKNYKRAHYEGRKSYA